MKWIKASKRLPEATTGYAKQIVTRWVFEKVEEGESNIQMRIYTANQLVDIAKQLMGKNKIEWLDESVSDGEKNKEIERLKGLIQKLWMMYNKSVMYDSQKESFWQQFKTDNNL